MDEEWMNTLSELKSVWTRVESAAPAESAAPEADESEYLRRAMQREADAAARYTALARLWDGRSAEALRGFAAQCRQNLKRLETAYFLCCGDTYVCRQEKLPTDGLLGYLRRAYLEEGDAATQYLRAAAATEQGPQCRLFRELEQSCIRRREALYALVYRVLG